jgi:hypothetical protein
MIDMPRELQVIIPALGCLWTGLRFAAMHRRLLADPRWVAAARSRT